MSPVTCHATNGVSGTSICVITACMTGHTHTPSTDFFIYLFRHTTTSTRTGGYSRRGEYVETVRRCSHHSTHCSSEGDLASPTPPHAACQQIHQWIPAPAAGHCRVMQRQSAVTFSANICRRDLGCSYRAGWAVRGG